MIKKIKKIRHYISLRSVVQVLCDECHSLEDAAIFIEEGLVEINSRVITDSYLGIGEGKFSATISGKKDKSVSYNHARENDEKIMHLVNQPENLNKLRDGEGLIAEFEEKDGHLQKYHLLVAPPAFDGDWVIACYVGEAFEGSHAAPKNKAGAVSECMARTKI